jgi:Zn-dependent protease with chaperone function
LILVLLVIALTATATVCLSALFVVVMLIVSYQANRAHHRALLNQARRVTSQDAPALAALVAEASARLGVGPVHVFVAPRGELNAYTFGLSSPKVVVLYSALLERMDADEMRFILGHEMGHIRLGHTELNSLVGGMAGIPSPPVAGVLLMMAFLWWNRTCEYSADRAGLLACGKLHKAISALVKLAAGAEARTPADLERALRLIEAEDDHAIGSLLEALTTHPMTVRRIDELRRYASSGKYRRLRERVREEGRR